MLIIPLIENLGGVGAGVLESTYIEQPQFPSGGVPTYGAAGALAVGIAAVTPAMPAGIQDNDIVLLLAQSSNEPITLSDAQGFVEVTPQQGTGVAAALGSTLLACYWKRVIGAQTDPTIADAGNHVVARTVSFRGCIKSGNPWDVAVGDTGASDTAVSIPGLTTTRINTLVVAILADGLDLGGARFSGMTNASLSSLTEQFDTGSANGNGGGLVLITGTKAAAGSVSATTGSLSSASLQARMTLALRSY